MGLCLNHVQFMQANRREYIVNSVSSLHMMVKSMKRKTKRPTNKAYSSQTAHGVVEATRETEDYVDELDTNVCIKLAEDSPAVLPLRR